MASNLGVRGTEDVDVDVDFARTCTYRCTLLPVSVDQCTECQSITPASGEVGHSDISVPTQEI